MKSMKPTLEDGIIGGFLFALLILTVVGAVSYQSIRRLTANAESVEHSQAVLTRLTALLSTATDAETGQRGYTVTGDEAFLEPFHKAVAIADAEVQELRRLVAENPRQQRQMEEIESLVAQRLASCKRVIELRRTQGFEAAQRETATAKGKEIHDRIRQVIEEMDQEENQLLSQRGQKTRASTLLALVVIGLGGVIAFVVIGAALVIIRRGFAEQRRAAERMRLIVEASPNALVMVDREGRITLINAQVEEVFGYSRAELIGQPIERLVPERSCAAHPRHRTGYLADPRTRAMGAGRDLVGLRKDGSEVPVEIGLSPIVTSEGTFVLVSITDITARKQAEAALERLQRHHERILNSVGEGVHGIDPDGKIVFENPAAAAMLGWDVQELIGRPAHAVMHHTRADGSPYPQGECHIYATLRERISHRVEDEVFWRKDGTSFPVDYTSTPIRSDAGEIVGAVVAFRDITERKRAEELQRRTNEELRIATEQAQAADRIKSSFLTTMSHELRTPLNSIIGFTGIILQGLAGPLNPEQTKQLGMVRGSARHLLALINDVLDISKIEAGQLEVSSEPFDVRACITKVMGIVAPLAEKKDLALRVDVAPEIAPAIGDSRRVEQVLLNLLNNAIKFTERGEVALAAEMISDFKAPGQPSAQPAVRVRVSDTGMGIKPEDLATLFQPFRQIDSRLSRNHEGTGLGLAIIRRLAELMGGEVRAESVWEKGSTFTFTLPLGNR